LSATGKAGGTIFGIGGDILNVNGAVNVSGATATAGLNFSVNVLGQTVYNFSNSQNAEWSKQDTISQPIDFGGATISVPIVGPISLDVTIGAQGNVGLNYSIYLNPTFISGNIEPFANANVYAQAGVGVPDIVEAGVGVNLTLVNFALQLGAKAGLTWFIDFILQEEAYGYINLNLLAGNLYAYAKIGHPCFDWPPWCVDQYNANIWSEPGLTFDYTLFDEKNDINLHWLTSANTDPQAPPPAVYAGTP
jgi:hypothetical protein